MNSVEASERIDKALEILTQERVLTPLDVNDPEVRNALNKAQEDLIESLFKNFEDMEFELDSKLRLFASIINGGAPMFLFYRNYHENQVHCHSWVYGGSVPEEVRKASSALMTALNDWFKKMAETGKYIPVPGEQSIPEK